MKEYVTINVNIPAEYMLDEKLNHVFVTANCTVVFDQAVINTMTFPRCTAFAIKPECFVKVIELIEQMAVAEVHRHIELSELYYHEIG